jgi:hypothetical protein
MEKEIRRIPFATLGKSFPHEELKSLECAIITGFPLQGNAGTLVDLTRKIGLPLQAGLTDTQVEEKYVYRVEPLRKPRADRAGRVIKSTSNLAIEHHTDAYPSPRPCDAFFLLACRVDNGYGLSTVVRLPDLIKLLDQPTIETLMEPVYPIIGGTRPILTKHSHGYRIRYSRYEIHRLLKPGTSLPAKYSDAFDTLDQAAESITRQIESQPGDCFYINNSIMLHGRTALNPKYSGRLYKRLRFHFNE